MGIMNELPAWAQIIIMAFQAIVGVLLCIVGYFLVMVLTSIRSANSETVREMRAANVELRETLRENSNEVRAAMGDLRDSLTKTDQRVARLEGFREGLQMGRVAATTG